MISANGRRYIRASAFRLPWRWVPTPPRHWRPSHPFRTPCRNTSSPACCAAPKTEVTPCQLHDLQVPATAEFILEGFIEPGEEAEEGPFGDHTGYYNSVEKFPVFTIERITHRNNPIYPGTYMGRAPFDEPSVMSMALNEVFIPLLQKQFPEIVDFYLPPEACSYRIAVVSIKKAYPGHARRIMFGVWSYLRQFAYTKFVIVTDDDINVRDWSEVIWAISTRMDPVRDSVLVENTPIDYLDFASPVSGLGSKIGFDATNKWPAETSRLWGRPISMSDEVIQRVDSTVEQTWYLHERLTLTETTDAAKDKQQHDSPFDLENEAGYAAWREQKLENYPTGIDELIVEIIDPRRLTSAEFEALHDRCRKTNMAIYAGPTGSDPDKAIPKSLGRQFGLTELDCNMGADDDGVTSLKVVEGKWRSGYIPYTNRPIHWHTDGYYNLPAAPDTRAAVALRLGSRKWR